MGSVWKSRYRGTSQLCHPVLHVHRPKEEDTHSLKGDRKVRITIILQAVWCGAKQAGKGSKNSVGKQEIDLSQNRRNIFNVVQGPERQGWKETLWKISGIRKNMSHQWLVVLACILTFGNV